MCLALAGCGTSPVENNANVNDNEQSSFETVQSKGGESSSSLRMLMFSKSAWRNAMIAMKIGFEVSIELENDSKTDISSVQVKIAYKDKDGNVVDSRTPQATLASQRESLHISSFSNILLSDGQTGDSVESIEAASYEYTTDEFYYSVDLVEKTVESHARNAGRYEGLRIGKRSFVRIRRGRHSILGRACHKESRRKTTGRNPLSRLRRKSSCSMRAEMCSARAMPALMSC